MPAAKTEPSSVSNADVVVDSSVKDTKNHLVEKLVTIGVTESKARALAAGFPDRIESQIAYLPHRAARDRAATLIYAIEGNWSVPPAYAEAQDMALREQREKEAKERIRTAQVAEQAEKERKKEAFAAAWEAMPDEDRSQMERTAWKHLAQSGGPIGSKAKDVLRGDTKPSEIMAGNAVRCVFQSMLEKMVVQDAEVSANLHGSPDPPNL